jgi:hypothetical protein
VVIPGLGMVIPGLSVVIPGLGMVIPGLCMVITVQGYRYKENACIHKKIKKEIFSALNLFCYYLQFTTLKYKKYMLFTQFHNIEVQK